METARFELRQSATSLTVRSDRDNNKLKYVLLVCFGSESLEIELNFLGLLVMENRLKIETAPVIGQLQKAKIRTIMVTGNYIRLR